MFATLFRAVAPSVQHSLKACRLRSAPVAVELIPAIGCSFITTVYTQRATSRDYANAPNVLDVSRRSFVDLSPSPGVMFTSSLVLGCCVSSFLYRHQKDDSYQALVFTSAIIGSVVVGQIAGADLDLILLGFLPWALCTAMFLSVCGHALLRWMDTACAGDAAVDDKTALLP